MKFGIVSGSHRKDAQSLKVARYIEGALKKLDHGHETYLLSLSENPLPLWDESIWNQSERWDKLWSPIAKELSACDAFIVISPEWSGMATPAIKNFFLLVNPNIVGHKPALLVAVSAAKGGAYPIAELRSSSYKNTRICYLPEHVIVRDVENMLNGDEASGNDDRYIRGRMDYSLKVLREYGVALKHVRESGIIDHKTYPNGMS